MQLEAIARVVKKRLIPILLLKDGRMVKGKHFRDFRDVGDPVTAARVYNAQKVDELAFIDIRPGRESRQKVMEIIQKAASECFIPLTVGGGVNSIEDINDFLAIGADKVSINSAAIRNPALIKEAAERYGDQCVVLSVDYTYDEDQQPMVVIDSGATPTGIDALEHIQHCVELGAGEVLLTCIDREGDMQGYDQVFLHKVVNAVPVPVIANGGAGTLNDFYTALTETGVSAVAAASIFHFTDQSPIKARFFLANKGVSVRAL